MTDVTLIIETDLACDKCYKRIQKVVCKLQEKEKIRTINFDVNENTVTISGPFDPVKLSRKLRCKACEAIKDIKIVKPEVKKPEEKKPAPEKKTEEKKPEEKKPAPEKKPEVNKPTEKKVEEVVKKPVDENPKPKVQTKPAAPPSTTVNVLQFSQICNLCYPWPCSDQTHWGGVNQYPKTQPQWPCEGMPPTTTMPPAFPGYQQPCQPWAPTTPKRTTCGGPAYCGGGCGSCGGGGMQQGWPPAMPTPVQMMQPPPMCSSGGPSSCRGCKGCRIVQEGRFIYEEYPQNSCAVM